jgi:carbamoyltransferase
MEKEFESLSARELIQNSILEALRSAGADINPEFVWVKHHDSHLGCALGTGSSDERLLLSLDGAGDGESGAFALSSGANVQVLARVPEADSLGRLYSAVTARYNFQSDKHEGKVTGLAAFGGASAAVDILRKHVEVHSGVPHIRYARHLLTQAIALLMKRAKLNRRVAASLSDIADMATSQTSHYADLAFAVQTVLEEAVCEIVDFWVERTSVQDLSLAGGVFSNVRLNQRIRERSGVKSVQVFPNMGDGGIALGGIWMDLKRKNSLCADPLYTDMYLAPELPEPSADSISEIVGKHGLSYAPMTSYDLHREVARLVDMGLVVGWHAGRMEFGPRALGHRSILLDPRRADIVKSVNARLKRTEFMPFAPAVLEEYLTTYFDVPSSTWQPFEYMTMTCDVRKEYRHLLPAITHVDGTARPQIVSRRSDHAYRSIIQAFGERTGIFLVVNTSLNRHEEPINATFFDSLGTITSGGIDILALSSGIVYSRDN